MSRTPKPNAILEELRRLAYKESTDYMPRQEMPSSGYLIKVAKELDLPVRCIRVIKLDDQLWHTFICRAAAYGKGFSSAPAMGRNVEIGV